MKYPIHLLLILSVLTTRVYADAAPIPSSPLRVVLLPTKDHKFNPDPSHTEDGKLVYSIAGHIFSEAEGKVVPSSSSTAKSTPLETLSELLSAYHAKDIDKVRSLYTPESASFFEGIASNPAAKDRWLQMMEKITGATVIMSFEHAGRTIVFARMEGAGFVTPLAFVKSGKQFLCSSDIGSDDMVTNIMLAFINFRMKPSDIIAP